jgi:hypothetical protein
MYMCGTVDDTISTRFQLCCVFAIHYRVLFCALQFPLCDGAHNAHNEETGDNLGPLVIKRKTK